MRENIQKDRRKYIANPLGRFRWTKGKLIYQDIVNRKNYQVDLSFLNMLFFLDRPRTKHKIVRYIASQAVLDEYKAQEIFHRFLNISLIIPQRKQKYSVWLDKNWRNALYFHVLTSNNKFIDMGQDNEYQVKERVLRSYSKEKTIPEFYKQYSTESIKLPDAKLEFVSSGKVLINRRTTRKFGTKPVSLEDLSTILFYATQPVKSIREYVKKLSEDHPNLLVLSSYTPYEIYFFASNVEGLEKGLYHYNIKKHSVSLLKKGDYQDKMKKIAIGQGVDSCGVIFMISSIYERYMWRYRNSRAFRNLLIEASSLAQRIIISAEATGLKNFLTPAIRDSLADELFGLDGTKESMTYLIAIGSRFEKND